jgi:DUF4097 and DUF4098 domain-containing protein YvlB
MKRSILSLLILAVVIMTVTEAADAKKKRETFNLDEVYSLAPDGTIYLSTEDAEIKIVGSDREDVHLVIDYEAHRSGLFWESGGDPFEVEVTAENGNLRIREIHGDRAVVGLMMHSRCVEYSVELEVPSGASLKLRGDDDDYNIRNVRGQISLRFEDGDAIVEDCNGDYFDLEVEDGSIEMTGGSGTLEAAVEDGEIFIIDGNFAEIQAEVEDGDIEIATVLSEDGTYAFDCEDGDIELTVLGGGGEFRITYEDGDVYAAGDFELEEEDDDLSIYTLSGGDARVRIRLEDGDVELRKK